MPNLVPGAAPPQSDSLDQAIGFQRDLYLYWREAATSDGLPLTTRRYVARPALRRVQAVLASARTGSVMVDGDPAEADDTALLFVRRLLERLSLLRVAPDGSRLLAADQREMARYLAQPLAERLRVCARVWVAGGWWPDDPGGAGELPHLLAPAPPRVALARRRAIELLIALEPGQSVDVPGAAVVSGMSGGAIAHARSSRRSLHERGKVARAKLPALPGETETLRAALLGPLQWMGFVRPLDEDRASVVACVALAALAAGMGGGDTSPTPALDERAGRVVVQSNLEVLALPPLTAPELLALDTCCERIALDAVARYRLTRPAYGRAEKAGWSVASVVERLEALTQTPLPPNVRTTLNDWARHAERVRLTPDTTVLEVDDARLLDALLADRSASAAIERRLAPTAALVRTGALAEVRIWLLRHGQVPAMLRSPGAHVPQIGDE